MDDEKVRSGGGSEKRISQNDADALKKCMEENKDDSSKCKALVEAFKDSSYSSFSAEKGWRPVRLPRGSLTDI